MKTWLEHYEEAVAYHNPNWHSGKVFNYAHNISTYYDAIKGCNMMIEKAEDERPDLVKQIEQRKKMYRAKRNELKAQAGILVENAGHYILSDAEKKRIGIIGEING